MDSNFVSGGVVPYWLGRSANDLKRRLDLQETISRRVDRVVLLQPRMKKWILCLSRCAAW